MRDSDRRRGRAARPGPRAKVMNVVRVSSGNFLEMFDFMVFGYYAASIGRTFFPNENAFASLMLALMTFGAGFLMRPIGAVILGAYIDRFGRRSGLILTLGLMAIGTLLIACLPGYAVIGVAAPIVILISRLVQGFSAGVELGGVSVYLSEIATPGHKGFYVSWQSASQQVAVMFAALIGVVLHSLLPPATMEQWGWRVPFWIGCLIIPRLYLLRRSLAETDEFLARKQRPSIRQILATLARNWVVVLIGLMMVTMTTVSFYLITAYTPTFGQEELHLSPFESLVVTLCVGISNFIWLPIMGGVSDRIGRRPVLITFTLAALLTSYPAMFWLVREPSFLRLLLVELWLSFIRALALIYLWQLQRRNGGDAHRDYANRGPNDRFFAGLQSGDRLVRRQYAGHLYLFDSYHEQQSHAGSLDVCSRFGGIGRCVVGGRKAGCAEFDSSRSVDLGADRLLY
jgi:MFS family permease